MPFVESSNGTILSTNSIIDKSGVPWSLALSSSHGVQVLIKGSADATTANVAQLLYWNHGIYQQTAGQWYKRVSGAWSPTTDPRIVASESPNGTSLTTTSGTMIDGNLAKWTLVTSASGLQIACNAIVDTTTSNVVLLLYWNHVVYQKNSTGGWWLWNGSWTGTSDPRVIASNTVSVNLASTTGVTVSPMLFGIGSSGDMAGNKFAITSNASWQAAARSLNMSLYRPNFGNSNVMAHMFAIQGSPDWSHIDLLLSNLPKFFNTATGRLLVTLGGNAPSWINIGTATGQSQFANLCVQIAQRFVAQGVECHWWELWNEPDSLDINTYCALFNATSSALKAYATSRGQTYYLGGVTDSYLRGDRIKTFANTCRPDYISYHQYATGPGDGSFQPGNLSDTPSIMQKAINNYAQAATDCRNAIIGTPVANVPIFIGEWNIVYTPDSGGGNYNIDPRQVTNVGAVFAALAMYSAAVANKNVTMAALWELYADTYYGVVRTDFSIDAQGYLFQRLAGSMGGQQVSAAIGGAMNLKCLATVSGSKCCIMLINYDQTVSYTINLAIAGLSASSVASYEISAAHLNGLSQTLASTALGNLAIPAMSVVIITA